MAVMIEGRRRPPMPGPPGRIVERIYRAVVSSRNRAFDAGRRVADIGVPVISVGNISVGGTGKTPMVAHIVRTLLDAGANPAIAMRGYKSQPGEPSDEEAQHEAMFPETPIVAQPDRIAGLRTLLSSQRGAGVDCVVLDDGFQHRFIARTLDIVLVDASRDPFNDRCLPAGWLREPVESLARADAVVITHAERVSGEEIDRLASMIEVAHGATPLAAARHAWSHIETPTGPMDVEALEGLRVYAVCAIGHPEAFVDQLKAAGAEMTGAAVLRDHARYTPTLARRIMAAAQETGAEAIATTEKDWVKLWRALPDEMSRGEDGWAPVYRPALALAFDSGEEALREAVLGAAGRTGVLSSSIHG
ncbi:MAG: tetraacyldisaccharide 4'-kinase [Phycisphaeraceae bacterium]|nr:MAG: tetraacyldisaccharide 4'-kinase [Phycisphaeraceae bacterium]